MAAPLSEPLTLERPRTGVLVALGAQGPMLSPFFARCDGLVVFASGREPETYAAEPGACEQAICDLILKSGVERLVCGFIAAPERQALRARGVDVRVGSCLESIAALVARFESLASA